MTFQVGDRIKYGRVYGTVRLVTTRVLWFFQEKDGAYRFAPIEDVVPA